MRVGWFALLLLYPPLLAASEPAEVVPLRVGTRALGKADVEARLAKLPPSRLARANAEKESPRALVEELVPELQWEQYLGDRAPTGLDRDRALAFALETRLARSVRVEDADIAAFHAANPRYFQRPESILVWRIVVQTAAEALEILNSVRQEKQPVEAWSKLARERSLDAATKMRRGTLGFVHESGHTEVPQVRVNPEVYTAASKLADGELAAAPLKDGDYYSALWRRGSQPKSEQTLEAARSEIERVLVQRRGRSALQKLLAELRERHVTNYHPDELEGVEYALPASTTARKPLVPHPAEGSPVPTATPDGDR